MIASVRCPQLVGRAGETALLKARFAAAERGTGSLTFVSGDAGIGKTRLIGDFLQSPETRKTPRAIGYCMEHARSPLAPLADIIWSLIDESPNLLANAAITRRVLSRLVPELAVDGDETVTASDSRAQYAALADLLRRAGEKKPAIIVIEDAQWADLSTIDFITFFAGRLKGTRVVMLVLHRPPAEGPDPLAESITRVRSNDNVYAIGLEPLTPGDMRRLSQLALGDNGKLSDSRLRQVHELADGNPLFAEELLGTALSSDGAVTLPASLRTLFLDRFSGLDAEDRETLTEAAVMGRSFDPMFLAQLTGRPIERILRTLRNARELQLVDDEGDGIVFRHALVRESLYASLLGAEARRLHRRMAEELETLPETIGRTSALAYHWWSAREPLKAFHANVLAGERAMNHLATTDAASFFERALSCAFDDEAARAKTECRLGAAYFASGFPAKAIAPYKRAHECYRTNDDMRNVAIVSIELGRQSAALGQGDDALAWRRAAVAAADCVVEDSAFRSTVYAHLVLSHAIRGEVDQSRAYVERAAADHESIPPTARLDLGEGEIFSHIFSGASDRAESAFSALRSEIERVGSRTQICRLYGNYAFNQSLVGNQEIAIPNGLLALERLDESIGPAYKVALLGIMGIILLASGEIKAASEHLARAEQTTGDLGQGSTRFTATLVPLGIGIGLRSGDHALVERYTTSTILEEATASREHAWTSNLIAAFAAAGSMRGDHVVVRAILRKAIDNHAPVPMLPGLALQAAEFASLDDLPRATALFDRWPAGLRSMQAYRALFDAYVASRKGRSAGGLARDAAERFAGLGLPLMQARAWEVAGDKDRARALYVKHGCSGDIERIDGKPAQKLAREGELSARERDVLPHVLRGRSNAEIASELNISERTVESHVRSILAKRGVKSRIQLTRADADV